MGDIATILVTVKVPFFDKNNKGKKYAPGQSVRFGIERANELIKKGIVFVESDNASESDNVSEKEKALKEKKTSNKLLDSTE